MDLVQRYWYLAVAVIGGAAWLWLFLVWRRCPERSKGVIGFLLFGPFLPSLDSYVQKRGGLTKREWVGWGIVILLMIAAVLFT